jgi:hypothetical protein
VLYPNKQKETADGTIDLIPCQTSASPLLFSSLLFFPRFTVLYDAESCSNMLRYATLCCNLCYSVVDKSALQGSELQHPPLCCTILSCICCKILYHTILKYSTLFNAVTLDMLHYIIL